MIVFLFVVGKTPGGSIVSWRGGVPGRTSVSGDEHFLHIQRTIDFSESNILMKLWTLGADSFLVSFVGGGSLSQRSERTRGMFEIALLS